MGHMGDGARRPLLSPHHGYCYGFVVLFVVGLTAEPFLNVNVMWHCWW